MCFKTWRMHSNVKYTVLHMAHWVAWLWIQWHCLMLNRVPCILKMLFGNKLEPTLDVEKPWNVTGILLQSISQGLQFYLHRHPLKFATQRGRTFNECNVIIISFVDYKFTHDFPILSWGLGRCLHMNTQLNSDQCTMWAGTVLCHLHLVSNTF